MKVFLALTKNLYTTISRDSFILFIFSMPVFVSLLFRSLLPIVRNSLMPYFDLTLYYPLIILFALVLSPLMSGMVIGFNLLDERDEDILSFMSITPILKSGYLLFKVTAPMLLVILQSGIILMILSISKMNYQRIPLLIVILCIETPLYALIIASIAGNKVEGLAVGKFIGIGLLGLFISYFFDSNMKYFASILPPFWIGESYFSQDSHFWITYIGGLIFHLLLLFFALHIFIKRKNLKPRY